ncbi:hypothetical protein DQ04_00091130 [Trypanosoma grayi]|uniref:hypothetical protein n=1 Tax=Trypanosoma grayi TaxID=71804 RepID=UPI0004F412E7|nr:hypothetical protein DQ04_00091130 [Trypanosoma grayi]KEG15379.1 hypothetical protein DQ04_00091130 [Trypanosoma grayi]
MAQHPDKIKWKSKVHFGLSASQFGMALGFCGRVVDYVDYLRNIVGTDKEFTGNASTAHGIETEPKARALYELLTGSAVSDGGFFLAEDSLLGCSPDGRIFYDTDPSLCGSVDVMTDERRLSSPRGVVGVRIPFTAKRRRQNDATTSPACFPPKGKCRLLEIKSPFNSLYDGSKPSYKPFGIPLHYLCQMQGQMAIADADECDFFVYLDRPACQVVAWRVRRSSEFWEWARPKLLQVVEWVQQGPPLGLNRRFEFEAFDFSKISVEPLVFPYDISANMPINEPRRFPFFERYPNPYRSKITDAHHNAVMRGLKSAVTRFLFYTEINNEDQSTEEVRECENMLLCSLPPPAVVTAAANLYWNSLAASCGSAADETTWSTTMVVVEKPCNFNDDSVTCHLCKKGGGPSQGNKIRVRYFKRDFFSALLPSVCPLNTLEATTVPSATHGENVTMTIERGSAVMPAASCPSVVPLSPSKGRGLSSNSSISVILVDKESAVSRATSVEICALPQ